MEWSREELGAAVVAYIEMREKDLSGERLVKKKVYESLGKRYGRSAKAFEYRMQNISYVYSVMGRRWVRGLKPAKNVGANILPIIEELINENEGFVSNSVVKFEGQVSKLREEKVLSIPKGNAAPDKKMGQSVTFNRNPEVVAWVLKNSNGFCEGCKCPAPFKKPDGQFYLEVHHMRRLADGGSDTITNALAVCPNCHRRLHYSDDKEIFLSSIYKNIDRLVKE